MTREFPTSRLLVTLGWAKSGEEAARYFMGSASRDSAREQRLRHQLRRVTRGLRLVFGELQVVAQRDEVLPRELVELLGLLVKMSEAILRPLKSTSLASQTRGELRELEEAIEELDDLVENQELACEVPKIYEDMVVRIAELSGARS